MQTPSRKDDSPNPPKVLVLLSNPEDTPRLRLDKEDRAFQEAASRSGVDRSAYRIIHAASIDDFGAALRESSYDIVHFSGHGSVDGIYLERSQFQTGGPVGPRQVRRILSECAPQVSGAFFFCCYSASSLPDLAATAPYVITCAGPVGDDAAIKFVEDFYTRYFETRDVKAAFRLAAVMTDNLPDQIKPVLSRRALVTQPHRVIIEANLDSHEILVDITDINSDIVALGLDLDTVASWIGRKLQAHFLWLMVPRTRALLSMGTYFGVFSWTNPDDVVVCHRLLRIRPGIDEDLCRSWVGFALEYSALYAARYRKEDGASFPGRDRHLKLTLNEFHKTASWLFSTTGKELARVAPDAFTVARAVVTANLSKADERLTAGDSGMAAAHMEAALSAIHDFFDAVTTNVTERLQSE